MLYVMLSNEIFFILLKRFDVLYCICKWWKFYPRPKFFEYRSKNFLFKKNNGRKNLKTNQFYRRSESIVVYQRCCLKGYLERSLYIKVVGYLKNSTLWSVHELFYFGYKYRTLKQTKYFILRDNVTRKKCTLK